MHTYRNLIILIASSLTVSALLWAGLTRIDLRPLSFTREKELTDFSFEKIAIVKREPPADVSGLICPVALPAGASRVFPNTPLSEVAPLPSSKHERKVSLILIREGERMAVIDGRMVKENDTLGMGRIVRIERDRVLMREGGKSTWVMLAAEESASPAKIELSQQQTLISKEKPSPSEAELNKFINTEAHKMVGLTGGLK